MGAMKTGGQGSVYKGRRIGEVISAIKILPTPIYSESEEDKNYITFLNEVQKLKRVNETRNPHVVSILSSGITETGNLPFIEMEFIDGPDLEDLLKPPHERLFTIKEVIKVADQLADALAHCHGLDVKHGDIKSNNVKYNRHTGNYVLLDFGLSVMSDEQRRTSLRQAGAIEFMAPEQNEGQMLFQTDVYSYGVILFELLSGSVPFPLEGKGETARNEVRLAHLQSPVPDVLALRRQVVSSTSWNDNKKELESQVPEWLLAMVYRCLEKSPEKRFANGLALQEYVVHHSTSATQNDGHLAVEVQKLTLEKERLEKEKKMVVARAEQYREQVESRERDIEELKMILARKEQQLAGMYTGADGQRQGQSVVSKNLFLIVLVLAMGLAGFAAYTSFIKPKTARENSQVAKNNGGNQVAKDSDKTANTNKTTATPKEVQQRAKQTRADEKKNVPADKTTNKPVVKTEEPKKGTTTPSTPGKEETPASTPEPARTETPETKTPSKGLGLYTVDLKAFFHNEPDESTRRAAFINKWNNAILAALDERNGFIYVVYTNAEGQTSRGWLNKKDLTRINR